MTAEAKPLLGKVAVVTGAGRGIGRAIAIGLANAGASVVCSARTETQIRETAAAINATGGNAMFRTADVASMPSMQALFEAGAQHFGRVDIVVANAGIAPQEHTVETGDPDLWQRIIDTNLTGVYRTVHAAIPWLKRSGGGRIIVLGSGAGHRGFPAMSAYSCSKAGLWMLVRVLAQELAADAISVNELIPGPVETDMMRVARTNPGQISTTIGQEWFKQPEDVVPMALFLATQPDTGPTGQSFSLSRRDS